MINKLKRIMVLIIIYIFILGGGYTFAIKVTTPQYTKDYTKWLNLSKKEKKNVIEPKKYAISKTKKTYSNPLKFARMFGGDLPAKYSLQDTISNEYFEIKNQKDTELCWAFSSLSSLETNLFLYNKSNNLEQKKYDFSERHMDYASTYAFKNGSNKYGANRLAESRGNSYIATAYLTNGMGAVNEADMKFDDYNGSQINLEELNKNVVTTVLDTRDFPAYNTSEVTEDFKNDIKNHIKNFGSVQAGIYFRMWALDGCITDTEFYNNEEGAFCCKNDSKGMNHMVSIIGWDDNYSKENFSLLKEENRPSSDGAWIIKNSYGKTCERNTSELIAQLKQYVLDVYQGETSISDEQAIALAGTLGWTISGDKATLPVGKDGIMYVSYEDVNIYKYLYGIEKAVDTKNYDYIYQYNETASTCYEYIADTALERMYLANIFSRPQQNQGKDEYIKQVSFYAPEKYTCRVLVNLKGSSIEEKDLQIVEIKDGDANQTKTVEAGYHTIEFKEPLKIESNDYVVAIEIMLQADAAGVKGSSFALEANSEDLEYDDHVSIEQNKCFLMLYINDSKGWRDPIDLSEFDTIMEALDPDVEALPGDSTIKAFTVIPTKIEDIEIKTMPTATQWAGSKFNNTGLTLKIKYDKGVSNIIDTGYTIKDENKLLVEGTNTIKVTYGGMEKSFSITAQKDEVQSIKIEPTTTIEVYEGSTFRFPENVKVMGTYSSGKVEEVTQYCTIIDGENIPLGKTSVSIKYGNLDPITQAIHVNQSSVASIAIKTKPTVTQWAGKKFNSQGLVLIAHYNNGTTNDNISTGYTIENENKPLEEGTNTIKVIYEGKEASFTVNAEKNNVRKIEIRPEKVLQFYEGASFKFPEDVKVYAIYDSGDEDDVTTKCNIAGGNNLTQSTESVNISYGGKEATQVIKVNPTNVTSIEKEDDPDKLTYWEGETFDRRGLTIRVHYNNGTSNVITEGFTIENENAKLEAGEQSSKTQDIKIEYQGSQTSVKITVQKNTLDRISIAPETTLEFFEGDTFVFPSNVKVYAIYKKGNSEEVTNKCTITDGSNLTRGKESVTVSYEGKTATQLINVKSIEVDSITIESYPDTLTYWEGDTFDRTGLKIKVNYNNFSNKVIDAGFTIENENAKLEAEGQTTKTQEIKITYGGKETKITITVKKDVLQKIQIEPEKTIDVYEGSTFKFPDDVKVYAVYEHIGKVDITDECTIENGDNLTQDRESVTVSYDGKTATQLINVKQTDVEKIEIASEPDKVTYVEGETFDRTGLKIKVYYKNKPAEVIDTGFTIDNEDEKLIEGTYDVVINYKGKTAKQTITVKKTSQEVEPENSDFDNTVGTTSAMSIYHYDKLKKEDFTIVQIELSKIEAAQENDKNEYYYSLSSTQSLDEFDYWIKIDEGKIENGKLSFVINTKSIPNYQEVSLGNTLYVYIKEVATKGNQKQEVISDAVEIKTDGVKARLFVDDVDKGEIGTSDGTEAGRVIPSAGSKIIFIAMTVVFIYGAIKFIKYKRLKEI